MSTSAGGESTRGRDIPAARRVTVRDASLMPRDYSTTPGGTVFSTTPGGTRIIYDRKFLLQCRTSPLARTPPSLPDIPGVTRPVEPKGPRTGDTPDPKQTHSHQKRDSVGEDAQFEMDI